MDFSVKFDGLDDLIRGMREISQDADKEVEVAVKETTAFAHRTLTEATPTGKTGHARRGWDMRFPSPLVGEVTTNLEILWFLEWGTGLFSEAEGAKREKYKIAPKTKKALAFQWSKAASLGIATSHYRMGTDSKGRGLYRTKAGNVGLPGFKMVNGVGTFTNAAELVKRKFVMHPGIKPVGMVRGNLPVIEREFWERIQAASDRIVERFSSNF